MKRIIDMMAIAAGPYRPQWQRTVRITIAGAMLNGLAIVLLLPLVRALIDGDQTTVFWLLAALVVVLVAESVVRVGELGFAYHLYPQVMEDARLRLGEHLRRIPAEELGRRRSGDLSVVLTSDVTNSLMAVSDVASSFLRLVILPLGLLAALAVIDWRLPLGALVGAAIAGLALARQNATMATGQRAVNEADAETADRVVEYVQGLPVLKAAGQVGEHSERLVQAMENQGRALNETLTRMSSSLTGAAIGANLAVAGIVAVGVILALGGSLTPAVVAAVVVAAAGLAEPLARAASMSAVFEVAEASLERINGVLAIEPLPVPATPATITAHDITLDRVTFSYRDATTPAVENVSLTLRAGSLTALVGPSGGGKTTVTRLITRYADPQAGSVRIGGVDLRDVEQRELMRHIAVVFQDVYLFDTTIAENVAMARPDASRADVLAALHAANCGPLLDRLPEGADTRVGEVGGQLSGGERQRVAIARALLKNAPIVLLDEPTSALDTESEVAVQEAIDRLVADRTVLVVAHRLSTVVAADQIVVLDGGHVVETGSHASLLAAHGRYAAMWAAQTRGRSWTLTASA